MVPCRVLVNHQIPFCLYDVRCMYDSEFHVVADVDHWMYAGMWSSCPQPHREISTWLWLCTYHACVLIFIPLHDCLAPHRLIGAQIQLGTPTGTWAPRGWCPNSYVDFLLTQQLNITAHFCNCFPWEAPTIMLHNRPNFHQCLFSTVVRGIHSTHYKTYTVVKIIYNEHSITCDDEQRWTMVIAVTDDCVVHRRKVGTERTHTRYDKSYEVLDLLDFPLLCRLAASCHGCVICVMNVVCCGCGVWWVVWYIGLGELCQHNFGHNMIHAA